MGQAFSLAVCVGVPVAQATAATWINRGKNDKWYQDLKKPKWTPPTWLFRLLDITMHGCMGTASWFIYKQGFKEQKVQLTLYGIQLLMGWLYNPMFFHCHEIGTALADVMLMDVVLTAATVMFFKESKVGGSLLVPYVAYAYFCTAFTAQTLCLKKEEKEGDAPEVPKTSTVSPSRPTTTAPSAGAPTTAAAAVAEVKKTA